ncbi:MAG: hypothetical protein KIH03_00210 [Paludibacteraceae bacterium]|nr:hypothetical protein [Paludibacteraceae bacterium]
MKKFNLIISLVTLLVLLGIIIVSLIRTDYHTALLTFVAFWVCLISFISERNIEAFVSAWKEDNEKQYKVNSSILEFTEDTIEHYNELYSSIDSLYMELKRVSPDNKAADEIIENLNAVRYRKDETDS